MSSNNKAKNRNLFSMLVLLIAVCVTTLPALAQTDFSSSTAGGTDIVNKASATYSDGSNTWSTESNTVTTTVAYVAGLRITPDSGTASLTPGGTASYTFTVSNLGNFTDEVRFLASGASITKTDASSVGTIAAAFIDVNANGTFDSGTDVDILTNGSDVTHSATQGGSFTVVVRVSISGSASAGATVDIRLGDATTGTNFDNVNADNSAAEVRTSRPSGFAGTVVNGDATGHNIEARGDITGTVATVGAVLNGPNGAPAATGGTPATNDTDYTNKSTNPNTTNTAVVFTNTLQNTGNAADTFTLTVPTYPTGATVEISLDGTTYTTIVNNGTPTGNTVTTASVAASGTTNYFVRVTLPSGSTTLTGYESVIRATSTNTPASTNDTIDRVWTGFLQLAKTATVANGTGIGGATDAVPGAVITYTITYTNVTPAATGSGSVDLTASSIVISEDGDAAPNNWATYTTLVTSPAPSDSNGGTITDGDTSGAVTGTTTFLKDSIASLGPNQAGTFTFKVTIK